MELNGSAIVLESEELGAFEIAHVDVDVDAEIFLKYPFPMLFPLLFSLKLYTQLLIVLKFGKILATPPV